jgi:hypothetical protein
MATSSVIFLINTGTSANSGDGDSLRTAFNKVNRNFLQLESSFVAGGVASFNSQTGIVTFTSTDIVNLLGFTPYSASNPANYVTQATFAGLATEQWVLDKNYVDTSTFYSVVGGFVTSSTFNTYVTGLATEQWVLDKGYVTTLALSNALSASLGSYITIYDLINGGYVTTSTINVLFDERFSNLTDIIPGINNTYDLGAPNKRWKDVFVGNALNINGIVLEANTVTGKLSINGGQGLTADFNFQPDSITNPRTFTMYASTFTKAAYVSIPTDTSPTTTERELQIVNTATPGILIQGNQSGIAIGKSADRMGTEFSGVIDLPVVLQGQVITTGSPTGVGTDKLLILASANYVTNPPPVPPETIQYYSKLDESITLATVNSATTAFTKIKIKGSMISLMPQSNNPSSVQDDDDVTRVAIIEREGSWATPIKIASIIGFQTVDNNTFGAEYYHRPLEINSSELSLRLYNTMTAHVSPGMATNATWKFKNNLLGGGSITFPDGSVQVTAYTGGGGSVAIPNAIDNGTSKVEIAAPNNKVIIEVAANNTWTFATNGNTTFPTGLTLGAPRGPNTVNFTSAIDKVFQIETQTNSTGRLWSFGTDGVLTVPSHIIPAIDIAYDLGSPTNRFRDIYVSSSTIYLGTSTISISATGQMLVNGNDAVSKLEYFGGEGVGPRDAGSIDWTTSTITFNIPGKELLTAIYDLKPGNKIRGVNTQLPQFGGFDQEFTIVGNVREWIRSGGYQMAAIDVTETTTSTKYVYQLYLPVKDKSATLANGTSTLTVSTTGTVVYPDGTEQSTAYNPNSIGLTWTISASGSSDYVFSGPGIVAGNTNDPVLYLYRGFTYKFNNTTGASHPFAIRVSNGGADYTSGVSGSQTGTQTFTVPMNAPSTLYYQCTIHSSMGNTINIV